MSTLCISSTSPSASLSLLAALHTHYMKSPLPSTSNSFLLNIKNKYFTAAVTVTTDPHDTADGLIITASHDCLPSTILASVQSLASSSSGTEFRLLAHTCLNATAETVLREAMYKSSAGDDTPSLAATALDAGFEYAVVRLDDLTLGQEDREKEGFARLIEAIDMSCWSSKVDATKANQPPTPPIPTPATKNPVPPTEAPTEPLAEDFETASAALLGALMKQGESTASSSLEEDYAMANNLEMLMASVASIRDKSMGGGFKTDEERKAAAANAAEQLMKSMGMDDEDFWDDDEANESEDEWGAAGDDLEFKSAEKAEEAAPAAEDEESWDTPTLPLPAPAAAPSAAFSTPMIIVNLSKLTHHKIHNKNDRNSNNDPALVSQHKKDIEADYAAFAASAEHLANAVVIPCGERVFAAALQQLRDDNPGHYFLPVFPPK